MRFYAIKPEVVDKVLGAGNYANWDGILDSFIEEQNRAEINEKRYSQTWGKTIKAQLQADLAFAEKVVDDYAVFLERTTMSGTAVAAEGENILAVLVLAISVLTSVNDLLDQMFALGIGTLLTALAGAGLHAEAKALQADLKNLQAELEKAKWEVKEAWAQLAINGAITAGLACAGPLGWLTLGAIGLGQIALDTYIGPSTSDAATWGSRGTTTLGTAASASQKYLDESSRVLRVAKPAGKVLPVVGFLFDANEIAVGYSNVEGLEKLMAKAKKAQDKLIAKIKLYKGMLSALAMKFEQLRKEVEKETEGFTGETRQTLEEEMERTGYRPSL